MLSLAGLLALLGTAPVAEAQGLRPRFSLDGFGTLGVSHSTERNADFVISPAREDGPGYTHRLDPGLDSRLAGQATALFGSRLTVLVQVLAEESDGEFGLNVEWANVSFDVTRDIRLRGGRIVMPAFLVSDSRKVSYSNPWIRPPVDLYGMVPIYTLDGADASVRVHALGWTGTLAAAFGRTEAGVRGGSAEGERVLSVNAAVARGVFGARVAAARGSLTTDLSKPLFDGFRAFGEPGQAIAARYDLNGKDLQFATAGVELDLGRWFAVTELGWVETNSAIGERIGGHVTGGVRIDRFTPYAAWSRADVLSERSAAGLPVAGLPPEHAAVAAQLNEGLNTMLKSAPRQQMVTAGARWDFAQNAALKTQVDFIDRMGNSNGSFINVQPGFVPGGSARLFSVAAEFVF